MTSEELNDLIDAWHDRPDTGQELHEYLGWTWEQYATWVETDTMPP